MAVSDNHKSKDWYDGMTAALVWVSDIVEKHQKALVSKQLLRKIDIVLILNLLDACLRRRELLSEVGADGVDLYVSRKRTVSLKEK